MLFLVLLLVLLLLLLLLLLAHVMAQVTEILAVPHGRLQLPLQLLVVQATLPNRWPAAPLLVEIVVVLATVVHY
jgi:hypothetical protein